jgi:hypothetical protein
MLKKRYRSARQVDGVIDLERLRSGPTKCIERDPSQFFDLTYPSEDLKGMLQALSRRFSPGEDHQAGLFLAEAVKGLGKSHAMLTAYHLFANQEPAKRWMAQHGYEWSPPQTLVLVTKKFTDQYLPFDSLWTAVEQEIGARWSSQHPPSLDELRASLAGQHLVLIFDELERGISNIADPARRSQNLSFLQMLSEEASRSNRVTLFAAIYDGTVEPGATLKRVPRVELRFRKPEDRAAIVRHRLFSDAVTYDRSAAEALIRSHINSWSRLGAATTDDQFARLKAAFPFLPGLLELVFERISGSGGFQGTRGALGLLAAMLYASAQGSFLFTGAHCKLTDTACADRLQDLDPAGSLINCARRNLEDLRTQPYAEGLASAVLLASLAPGIKGLTREELIRHAVFPGCDPNRFEATLQAFRTFGTFFHEREGRFFFDLEENENAKVEIEAMRLSEERARDEIVTIWKQDLFRETQQAVIFADPETTKLALDQLTKSAPRFVFSPRRLSAPERHALYFGSESRNQIILLEPRDDTVNHLANPDIVMAAKRSIAAATLAPSAGSAERRNRYERISAQERGNVRDLIKSAGLAYVRVETWGERPENARFEMESLGQSWDKQSILDHLRRHIYPRPLFLEHLKERLSVFYGRTISQVDREYRSIPGFPVPTTISEISDAVIALAEDRSRILGLQHPRRNYCGERVDLGAGELPQAVLAPPWPASMPAPVAIPHAPEPSGAPPEPPAPRLEPPMPEVVREERVTPYCRTKAELRQAVAEKLSDVPESEIAKVKFQVFSKYQGVNLADHPSAIRGGLTCGGDLEVQIDLAIPGPLDKAQIESLCESLPNLPDGTYSARLSLVTRVARESSQNPPEVP